MARIKDKVRNALDEARMLALGTQVIVGLLLRSFFEKGFESLPVPSQALMLAGPGLMLVAAALLVSPAAYHRLVERGEDTEEIHSYTSRLMGFALLPLALGLGVGLYVATQKIIGWRSGAAAGLLGVLVAVFFWYLLEMYRRRERADEIAEEKRRGREMDDPLDAARDERRKLGDKIEHVLTECRVVLPGVQALLGFQFIAILADSFERLPSGPKYVHLACIGLSALTIILLMTPAAYHRLVERGQETEHFHRFASKVLVAALVPLALGMSGDVYVVVQRVTDSQLVSVVSALVILAIFWELWFGLTLYRRTQRVY